MTAQTWPLPPSPRLGVVIISAGRPAVLGEMLATLVAQTVAHEAVVVAPSPDDLPSEVPAGVRVVLAGPGISLQRNRGIDSLTDPDLVFFFDDDAVLRRDYLARATKFFAAHPAVVGLTGRVLMDGAQGEEIDLETSLAALKVSANGATTEGWRPTRELYGCNFAYRYAASPGLRFDERLLKYSWLEDLDFASRLRRSGDLAKVEQCVIVHRGVSSGGRTRHRELGYVQVMNPVYLWHKKSVSLAVAVRQSLPLVAKNLLLALGSRHRARRRERLHGNALALRDIVRGRIAPERVLLVGGPS